MDNILISTIRFGAIMGIALFASVGEVFAAPTLTPAVVEKVTETRATFSVLAITPPLKKVIVYFEYFESGNTSAAATPTRATKLYEGGSFVWDVNDLRPCTNYSFRAIAMEDGVTVLSPNVGSFKTKGCPAVVPVAKVIPTTAIQKGTQVVGSATQIKKAKSNREVVEDVVPILSNNTPINSNTASIVGTSGVMPSTLVGWVALLISIFVALLIVLMIFEKKAENRTKKHALILIRNEEDEVAK